MKLSPPILLTVVFIVAGLLWGVYRYWPDGKLHIVFCAVGQGDAIYIRAPNQADILIDGGPNARVLDCLGKYMPFFDRQLEMVVLTHPQKDHYGGLVDVLKRYSIKYFVTIQLKQSSDSYREYEAILASRLKVMKYPTTGDRIKIDQLVMDVVWPAETWLAHHVDQDDVIVQKPNLPSFIPQLDLNTYSLYLHLQYGSFDALFTGDGDISTQEAIVTYFPDILPKGIELLKVPHHGSCTGVSQEFAGQLKPRISIVQVGKNSYGHPCESTLKLLDQIGDIYRTDKDGTIEIISDGKSWKILKEN